MGQGDRCPVAVGVMDEPSHLPVLGAALRTCQQRKKSLWALRSRRLGCPLPAPALVTPLLQAHGLAGGRRKPPRVPKNKGSKQLWAVFPGTRHCPGSATCGQDARGVRTRGTEGGGALRSAFPLPVLTHLRYLHRAHLQGARQRDASLYPQAGSSPTEPGLGRCFRVLGLWSRRCPGGELAGPQERLCCFTSRGTIMLYNAQVQPEYLPEKSTQ